MTRWNELLPFFVRFASHGKDLAETSHYVSNPNTTGA